MIIDIIAALTTENLEDAKSAFKDLIRSFAMLDQSKFTINSDQIDAILTNSREDSEKKLIQDIFNETTATVSVQRPLSAVEGLIDHAACIVEVVSGDGSSSSPASDLPGRSQSTLSLCRRKNNKSNLRCSYNY